jgi:hypothetical protein
MRQNLSILKSSYRYNHTKKKREKGGGSTFVPKAVQKSGEAREAAF